MTWRWAVVVLASAASSVLAAQSRTSQAGDARITTQPPADLQPAGNLSEQDRHDNFEALWRAVDVTYAHFKLKSIDWNDIGRRYRARLDDVRSDDEFYRLMARMIGELKDTHSWLQNYRDPPLADVPSVAVDLVENKPFIVAVAPGSEAATAGVTPGSEVVSVDGISAAQKMEALRPWLRGFSSERAFHRDATRRLLASDSPAPAAIAFRLPNGDARTATLARAAGRRLLPPGPSPIPGLTRQTDLQFGILPSDLGYIRILSFANREPLDREFDAALDAVRNTPGLILDIRDNSGGFSHSWIVGRFLHARVKTAVSFIKNGEAHDAFRRQAAYDSPTGPWQYTRPLVVLVNDLTGSASDLFVTELRSAQRITVVGSTTHGNLSGTAAYAVLPCNLVVRISNGYVADANGRAIEVNGNVPDVAVEPTMEDVLNGRDPVLARAVTLLKR